MWIGIWMCHHAVTTTLVSIDLGSQMKSWVTAGCQTMPWSTGWGSKPTWNGSHILSKQKQGDWEPPYVVDGNRMCHHAGTTTLVGPDLGSQLKPLVTAVRWTMPWCSAWGSKPTWNGCHILFKQIQGDWEPSYAVDGNMDVSPCRYYYTCWPRFGKSVEILGHCCVLNNAMMVQCMRL